VLGHDAAVVADAVGDDVEEDLDAAGVRGGEEPPEVRLGAEDGVEDRRVLGCVDGWEGEGNGGQGEGEKGKRVGCG
jgi:hypothetical protein